MILSNVHEGRLSQAIWCTLLYIAFGRIVLNVYIVPPVFYNLFYAGATERTMAFLNDWVCARLPVFLSIIIVWGSSTMDTLEGAMSWALLLWLPWAVISGRYTRGPRSKMTHYMKNTNTKKLQICFYLDLVKDNQSWYYFDIQIVLYFI